MNKYFFFCTKCIILNWKMQDVNVRDIFFRQIGNYYLVFYLFFENCSVFILQAEILSSARALTGELTVISLGGEDEWSKTRGKKMIIFLFNDVIEIAKVIYFFVFFAMLIIYIVIVVVINCTGSSVSYIMYYFIFLVD